MSRRTGTVAEADRSGQYPTVVLSIRRTWGAWVLGALREYPRAVVAWLRQRPRWTPRWVIGSALELDGASLKELLTSQMVRAGLFPFALSAVVWLLALSRVSLSFAYPFAARSYVVIVLLSLLVLREDVPPLRWAGWV